MITILLSTHYFSTHRGGVEIAAFNLAKNIIHFRNDIKINWIASDSDETPHKVENLEFIPINSTNFIEKLLPFPYPLPLISGIKQIYSLVQESDIVHIHDFLYFSNILTFLFAKIKEKRIIVTQHIGFIPYKNAGLRFLLSFLNKTLGKFILSHADNVVFISKSVQKYFESFISKKSNFSFIPNGLDTNIYKIYDGNKKKELRRKYHIEEGINLLFVGRFTEKKGLYIIRELAKSYQDINFILAGWGNINPNEWKLDNIRVLSDLEGNEIAELYNISDALILASYGEGFPLVVGEAMVCGLPVLLSREVVSGYPLIESLISGVISHRLEDIEESRKALDNFIENYKSDTKKSKILSEFARENWGFEQVIRDYLEIFKI